MRHTTLAGVVGLLLAGAGCSSRLSESSLQRCSDVLPCSEAEERCYLSQACGPPAPDGSLSCRPEQGDRRCHRSCDDSECPDGERCTSVVFYRGDVGEDASICLAE